jgi:hypothetical protein
MRYWVILASLISEHGLPGEKDDQASRVAPCFKNEDDRCSFQGYIGRDSIQRLTAIRQAERGTGENS